MPEVEDQDEVALLQLASGLKSEVSSLDDTSLAKVATEPACGDVPYRRSISSSS